MSNRLITHLFVALTLACFYAASYSALLQQRSEVKQSAPSSSGIWNLPPMPLLAVAGEFKGLMADYLTMEAGAQLGTELVRKPEGGFRTVKKQYDWPNIHRLFVASQILDPSFAQTFTVAQGWLPWTPPGMIAETQNILQIAAKNRPWDWQPYHSMGFNTYYFLNQPGEAGKLFLEAARVQNAPAFLPILGARLAQKGGETETAIVIIKSMLADKNPEEPGYADMVDRLHALEGVRVIEQATTRYEKALGRKPSSLAELTTSGILAALPPNPYNLDYCMDTAGIIYFDKPDCRNPAPGGDRQ
ncbi:MAG: tetratricopeptide repeat protein [Desulfobulbia bacterium]